MKCEIVRQQDDVLFCGNMRIKMEDKHVIPLMRRFLRKYN